MEALRQKRAEVIAISVDSVEDNARMAKEVGLTYPILSDGSLRAIDAYDLRHMDGGPSGTVARSATFVVDGDGVVRWRDLTESYRVRPRAEEVEAEVAKVG